MHAAAATRLPSRILGSQRRLHPLPRKFQRVLQSEKTLGSIDYGQHYGLTDGLQTNDQNQRQHLLALHHLPGEFFNHS